MQLIRVSEVNGRFSVLLDQWMKECDAVGEDFHDFATPLVNHARTICTEPAEDPRYGIFAVEDDGSYAGLMHVNQARLPGTTGYTLRILWVLLAPRFDYAESDTASVAAIASAIIYGAIRISETQMVADHIKIHLNNMGDRQFCSGVAVGLRASSAFKVAEVKASWLHLTKA